MIMEEFEYGLTQVNSKLLWTNLVVTAVLVVVFVALNAKVKRHDVERSALNATVKRHEMRWRKVDRSFSMREYLMELKYWLHKCYGIPLQNSEKWVQSDDCNELLTHQRFPGEHGKKISKGSMLAFLELIRKSEDVGNWFAHQARPQVIRDLNDWSQMLSDEVKSTQAQNVNLEAYGIYSLFVNLPEPNEDVGSHSIPFGRMCQVYIGGEGYVQVVYKTGDKSGAERQKAIRTVQYLYQNALAKPCFFRGSSPENIVTMVEPASETKTVFYRGILVPHEKRDGYACCHDRSRKELLETIASFNMDVTKELGERTTRSLGLGSDTTTLGYVFVESEGGGYHRRDLKMAGKAYAVYDLSKKGEPLKNPEGRLLPILN